MSGGGACGKWWWYAEVCMRTGAKFGETRLKRSRGWSCSRQGPDVRGTRADVRAPGSWSNEMISMGKRATPGQNSYKFVDGNCGEEGEKLDPHVAKQIRGSNPTKLHHTNKSQKKLGLFFWWGFSDLGRKQQNQARKHGVGAPRT